MGRCLIAAAPGLFVCMLASAQHRNLRDYGIAIGVMQPGPWAMDSTS